MIRIKGILSLAALGSQNFLGPSRRHPNGGSNRCGHSSGVALARRLVLAALVCGLVWLPGVSGRAQIGDQELNRSLVKSYDLLEAGKLAEAKQIYEEILEKHPNNPLALNNLGAIYVRQKDYQQALNYLERALPRAKSYRVLVNRVCDVDGICLAFRPAAVEYGHHDLEPLIAANIEMVKAKFAANWKLD
jgi:tetratricopeptide (TPR) repeat protein